MEYRKVMCVASRGRGPDNEQHFEARTDRCSNTITSVLKDSYLMPITFPKVLSKRRSEEGKRIRRLYKNDIGVPYQQTKQYQINQSGVCDCVTTFLTDNNIIDMTDNKPKLIYRPEPTKEDLLEYFSQRIRIRKMTEIEALKLMDLDDSDIDKIVAYPFKSTNSKEWQYKQYTDRIQTLEVFLSELKADKKGAKWYINNQECSKQMLSYINSILRAIKEIKKNLNAIKKQGIAKTSIYKLAGNSIVVSCLYHIFRVLFLPNQPENKKERQIRQLSLFDEF